jgi:hypothetical protein
MVFVHPGALNNQVDLDFVKAKIAADEQPWAGKFKDMLKLATPYSKTFAPQDGAENDQKEDALKAYASALAWYYTGDERYAQNALAVFSVWSATFKGYAQPAVGAGNQSQLNASWIGALLGPAAEIMRGYAGWSAADRANLQVMFKSKFYPILNQMSYYNGNNDLTQIDALMNIAVFCDDEAEFNLGVERLAGRNPAYFYLKADPAEARDYGGSNESKWYTPVKWVDGLMQETCRDLGHHAQYGLASALHAAEVAHNQGVDIYGQNEKRYVAALELMAKELLRGEARFDNICAADASGYKNSRADDFFDTWELGYHHYHGRMGHALPNTALLIATKIRPGSSSDWNIFYETLTHGDSLKRVAAKSATHKSK